MKRTAHTQKWIDALRSGEYRQTKYVLRDEVGHCCLGVASELMGLPCAAIDYSIIREEMGISIREQERLVELNDIQDKTFQQIADEIEKMTDVS